MEVLNECRLLEAKFSQSRPLVTLKIQLNGQLCIYVARVYQSGLLAFDFPEDLRQWLRNNPNVSHSLMGLLQRLKQHQATDLPANLLTSEVADRLQAA